MLVLVIALAAAASQVPTAQPAQKNDDPIICKRENIGTEVGTHMRSKKVCLRKSDRDLMETYARDQVRAINNRGDGRLRDIPIPR